MESFLSIFTVLDEPIGKLAALGGFPADQLKYLIALIFVIPLSLFYRFVSSKVLKHIYSIVIGVSLLLFTMPGQYSWEHLFFSGLVTYLIII